MVVRSVHALTLAQLKRCFFLLGVFVALMVWASLSPSHASPTHASPAKGFPAFVEQLRSEALKRGVSRATFDQAFQGLTPNPAVMALTKKQSEFVKPIWGYLESGVSANRITRGQSMLSEWGSTLSSVESRYGVPPSVVLGIWGMETNFGRFTGDMDVIRSLATLAYARYRGTFFRDQLLIALTILQQEHITRDDMTGSWAGAMGQTQFMPTSFRTYAVDFNGDGHRDIWRTIPDALASTANYLKGNGWDPGLDWGYEVSVPDNFDYRQHKAGFAQWSSLGVRRMDGKSLPSSGEATLYLPAGASGPAFLVTKNFDVIKSYNNSDAYALAVAHLGDRIIGRPALQGEWPKDEEPLTKSQRQEVQKRLASLGLYNGDSDGRLGSQTRLAVRQFQLKKGLVADGYANIKVLQALRGQK